MINQHKRNQQLIIIIFAMSIVPFLIAWFLLKNPDILSGRTNHGQLIAPVITTEREELQGFDQFSQDNLGQLPGHWVLLHVMVDKECNKVCQEAIFKSRQLRLMMSKDLTRLRRAVIMMQQVNPEQMQQWWHDDARLLKLIPSTSMRAKLSQIRAGELPEGWLLLMDPMGNLMMQYEPDFDPYKVKSDLKNLLKISQIG